MDANILLLGADALLEILQKVRSAGGASCSDCDGEMMIILFALL